MHAIEVERKRRLPGTETGAVAARLAALGFHRKGAFVEVDTYYSRPDADYLETVECLRVRQRDGFAEITYKPASTSATHRRDGIIAKPETNVILADAHQAEAANQLLAVVGMTPLARVEKSRTLYRHPDRDDVTISLDAITDVGVFVETEVIATDTIEAATCLEDLERQLGFTILPVVSSPYRDLVLQHASHVPSSTVPGVLPSA
ncbi:class IV adenylate cyclase [Marinitenerispora sediminis]|uniref:Class IV adenylate cyclase n=1 Tax=Marinitenerispora sediminis TaxID=1931232 RepID=A0A368T525_9ACTN|nr:class IV adenylate cyclase [Marinitenerispora sediminis]RCV54290.1 class IV adenylate cyclase [Marinitenerispora sediminis]RCV56422.1 class IV adenylate cyclase [Marinitenerispora sediminis]RCV58624.1 class IV adenylate cyclase [Marinitenerispora sediminis]